MIFSQAKDSLRKRLLERRKRLSFEEVHRLSSAIQRRFLDIDLFVSAQRIALYASFQNEVLTDTIFSEAKKTCKEVFYPRVTRDNGAGLSFYRVDTLDELCPGSYTILEPPPDGIRVDPEDFDLIVVPGVGFDTAGGRLGYGKGYYDRILRCVRCPAVALAFDFQVLDEPIPLEDHDIRVDAIVTERRFLDNIS